MAGRVVNWKISTNEYKGKGFEKSTEGGAIWSLSATTFTYEAFC